MKKLGILGGMSWESTITYYQTINEKIGEKLGGCSSADMVIRSLDLRMIEKHQSRDEWHAVADILCKAAGELEQAGAELIVMASNTVHKVYDEVQASVGVPVLHIADSLVDAVQRSEYSCVGLVGTRYTMQGDFLSAKLSEAGIKVIVPDGCRFDAIHEAIFNEGCVDGVREETRSMFGDVIRKLADKGAQGVILGCTELGLMITPENSCLPIFDTAVLHAEKAAELILRDETESAEAEENQQRDRAPFARSKKYVKKPVVIEAYQTDREMTIHTLEGDMKAIPGDYIITGVNGEQYPCKPDIFQKTYGEYEE